jgi:hypothetical protein
MDVVPLGDITLGRGVFEPVWRWSNDVKPIAGTDPCQVPHRALPLWTDDRQARRRRGDHHRPRRTPRPADTNHLPKGGAAAAMRFCSPAPPSSSGPSIGELLEEAGDEIVRQCCNKGHRGAGDLPVGCLTERSNCLPVRLTTGWRWRSGADRHRPDRTSYRRLVSNDATRPTRGLVEHRGVGSAPDTTRVTPPAGRRLDTMRNSIRAGVPRRRKSRRPEHSTPRARSTGSGVAAAPFCQAPLSDASRRA